MKGIRLSRRLRSTIPKILGTPSLNTLCLLRVVVSHLDIKYVNLFLLKSQVNSLMAPSSNAVVVASTEVEVDQPKQNELEEECE